MLGGLFKQSLAVVKQNGILKYLEFSWIFYLDIYFCEQYQGSKKQLVSSWRTFIWWRQSAYRKYVRPTACVKTML